MRRRTVHVRGVATTGRVVTSLISVGQPGEPPPADGRAIAFGGQSVPAPQDDQSSDDRGDGASTLVGAVEMDRARYPAGDEARDGADATRAAEVAS